MCSPAVGLLWFGQRVVKKRISVIDVVQHFQVQVQTLPLPTERQGPVVGRLLLEVSFTQRRRTLRVLIDNMKTTTQQLQNKSDIQVIQSHPEFYGKDAD